SYDKTFDYGAKRLISHGGHYMGVYVFLQGAEAGTVHMKIALHSDEPIDESTCHDLGFEQEAGSEFMAVFACYFG
ncbi:MAG: hypothetical protein ACKPKO_03565, partial [Candidatus Fonsibacter sp.]